MPAKIDTPIPTPPTGPKYTCDMRRAARGLLLRRVRGRGRARAHGRDLTGPEYDRQRLHRRRDRGHVAARRACRLRIGRLPAGGARDGARGRGDGGGGGREARQIPHQGPRADRRGRDRDRPDRRPGRSGSAGAEARFRDARAHARRRAAPVLGPRVRQPGPDRGRRVRRRRRRRRPPASGAVRGPAGRDRDRGRQRPRGRPDLRRLSARADAALRRRRPDDRDLHERHAARRVRRRGQGARRLLLVG